MRRSLLLMIILVGTKIATAQGNDAGNNSGSQSEAFREKYISWFNQSLETELPQSISLQLDSFFTTNLIDDRLKSKVSKELKMCFNLTISIEDRKLIINKLISKYQNAVTTYPVFLLYKERERLNLLK